MTTVGISTWSVRRLLGPVYPGLALDGEMRVAEMPFGSGGCTLLDLPTAIREHGYTTLDLCHFHLPQTDDAYLDQLKGRLADAGVELLTFLVDDGDLGATNEVVRQRDVAATRQWIAVAARLGARYVRVAAGLAEAAPADPAIAQAARSLTALAAQACECGTTLITETWRPLALPPENLRAILAATDGAVGHCADFNNYAGYGDPAKYDALRAVLPGAVTVHAGGQFDGAGTFDREDFRRCMALARESGFDGPYVLIFSGPGDEWAGLATLAAAVRAA
jgi:sugar phosphate isomerase/epimerase